MACIVTAYTPSTTHKTARHRGVESSQRLGRHRYVIERTLEWITRFRRLQRRYERKAAHFHAFATLAYAIVCYRRLSNKRYGPTTSS
jgi:transposase